MKNEFSPQPDTLEKEGIQNELKSLIEYAVAAPSTHNSQPWKFLIKKDSIVVSADLDCWLPFADPDKRELWISIGCAIENLLVAARFMGFEYMVTYNSDSEDDEVVKIYFNTGFTRTKSDELFFENILPRHTSHKEFNSDKIPTTVLQELEGLNDFEELKLLIWEEDNLKAIISNLIKEADLTLLADSDYRNELSEWIGKGVFGTPWLISKIGQLVVSKIDIGKIVSKQDQSNLKGAPSIAFINALDNKKETQVKVGMLYERIALFLNNYNVRTQPISGILEAPETREKVQKLMPEQGTYSQLFFRMGYGVAENRRTPRRDLDKVISFE